MAGKLLASSLAGGEKIKRLVIVGVIGLVVGVGMNSIFIYTFMETVGKQWFRDFVGIFVLGFLGWFSIPEGPSLFVNGIIVLALAWGLCFWLYRKRIFIKV